MDPAHISWVVGVSLLDMGPPGAVHCGNQGPATAIDDSNWSM